jgi:hypothetical protein
MYPSIASILTASIVQFIIGFIWYTPIFGKLWGKIHSMGSMSKEEQAKMMKTMGPMFGLQFFMTIVTTVVLGIFLLNQPSWNPYAMAGFFWIGFVVPTQVSAVIFGGTAPKWIAKKIAIMAGASFFCLEAAAAILSMMK